MSVRKCLVMGSVLILITIGAIADPIKDLTLDGYRAAWYPNISAGKSMTCPEVCKESIGGLPEYEASSVPVTKRAFVCKVQGEPKGNIRTWLYGSQFDDRKACYTVDLSLKGKYSEKYFCLCVARAPR